MRMWLSSSCVIVHIVSIVNLLFILLGHSTIEKTMTMTTVFLVFVDFRLIMTICFISLTKHLTAWWRTSEHLMATHLIKSRVPTSLIPFHSRIVTVANWTILNIVTTGWAQKSKPLLIYQYIGLKPADKATFLLKLNVKQTTAMVWNGLPSDVTSASSLCGTACQAMWHQLCRWRCSRTGSRRTCSTAAMKLSDWMTLSFPSNFIISRTVVLAIVSTI